MGMVTITEEHLLYRKRAANGSEFSTMFSFHHRVVYGSASTCYFILSFLMNHAALAEEPTHLPKIEVVGTFGDAQPNDIAAVLRSAVGELSRYLPQRKDDLIRVAYSKEGPIVLYDRGPNREYQVRLNVEGRYWSQFAYQYAHEHCHILCNYRAGKNPNKWFEESLCELASIFVIRRMSHTWQENPPYPNWKSYHASLAKYAEEHVAGKGLPAGKTLAEWYREQEAELRKTATDRPRNQIVALALLPLFEKEPAHWLAVDSLNSKESSADQPFAEYLENWHAAAPASERTFIAKIAHEFGVKIGE